MLAYEYIERQLVHAFSLLPECRFEHYCYDKLPVYHRQLSQYEIRDVLNMQSTFSYGRNSWTANTWFFIFSGAGGHSGIFEIFELNQNWKWWLYLKKFSEHVYWINPISPNCWKKQYRRKPKWYYSNDLPLSR